MRLILLLPVFFTSFIAECQEFLPAHKLEGGGRIAWTDFENDGSKELIYTSQPKMKIYVQAGNNFVDIDVDLPGVAGEFDLGDYDGDNDIDVLLGGLEQDGNRIIRLYKNNGNYNFEMVRDFAAFDNPALAFADIDKDGDLDIYTSGQLDLMDSFVIVYRNLGNDTFEDAGSAGLPVCFQCSMDWEDLNNDGFVDVALMGYTSTQYLSDSRIYLNNQDFTFAPGQALQGLTNGTVSFGDYEGDGDLDLVQTGASGDQYRTIFYENVNGLWTEREDVFLTPITDSFTGGLKWVDMNRDDKLDIVLAGRGGSNTQPANVFQIFVNNYPNGFTELLDRNLDNINAFSIDAVDYDGDDFVDLAYAGYSSTGAIVEILRNAIDAPTLGSAKIKGPEVIELRWQDNSHVEENFVVERSEGNDQTFAVVSTLSNDIILFNDTYAFKRDTWYYYKVYAKDAQRVSQSTTFKIIIPASISTLEVNPINATKIKLQWTDQSTSESTYAVDRKLFSTSTFEQIAVLPPNTSSFTVNNLLENTKYEFAIRSVNSYGSAGHGNVVTAKTNSRPTSDDIFMEAVGIKPLNITSQEFLAVFNDADPADNLKSIIIESLPGWGFLRIDGVPFIAPKKITATEVDKLTYQASQNILTVDGFRYRVHDGKDSSNVAYVIKLDLVMGLANKIADPQIMVSPNPASNFINVTVPEEWENAKINLLDSNSRVVYSGNQRGHVNHHNIEALPKGVYILSLVNGKGQVYYSRIVIYR